jgi:hypothetical protein
MGWDMHAAQREIPLKVVPGERMDTRALAARVFERHGIALKDDDPAFALVTLNELVLRKLMSELQRNVDQHITARMAEFEQIMQRVEGRAGKVLAQQVRDSGAGFRATMQEDLATARAGVEQMIVSVRDGYRIAVVARWSTVCAVVVVVAFACGFWAGRF